MEGNRGALFWVAYVAAFFGPYLAGGIRTEQAVIYGTAGCVGLLLAWRWPQVTAPGPLVLALAAWGLMVAVATLGTLGETPFGWPAGSTVAGLDNLLSPLAVATAVLLLVTPARSDFVLRRVAATVAVLTAANGAVAIAQTRAELTLLLRPFWGADTGLATVSEAAATMGRFSGIFNQPAEAGLMYGLAGLCAVYVWAKKPRVLYPLLVLIFLGGVLCVSKVFLLVGAPLILWQVWRNGNGKVVAVIALALTFLGLRQFGLLAQWTGLDYALRLLNPPEAGGVGGLMSFYTAGRLGGQTSTLSQVVDYVLAESPLSGFGAAGMRVPYDNGWVEALVVAGLIGAAAYTLVLVCWFALAVRLDRAHRGFAVCTLLLVVGASTGLPALTANRAGAALWLVLVLLALMLSHQQDQDGSGSARGQSGGVVGPAGGDGDLDVHRVRRIRGLEEQAVAARRQRRRRDEPRRR